MKNLLEQLINGLSTGSIYALIALGYTMVYGIAKMINFAHGDIMMVGAYTTFLAITEYNIPLPIAIILSMIICAILGIIIDRLAYKPLRNSPRISALITAIGVSFLLESVFLLWQGATPKVINQDKIPFYLSSQTISLGSFKISYLTVVTILTTIFCMLILDFFIKKRFLLILKTTSITLLHKHHHCIAHVIHF